MPLNDLHTSEQSPQSSQRNAATQASVSSATDDVSRRSGESLSRGSSNPRSRKAKKRNRYVSHRSSLWSRLSAPILQCRRCGERYRVSWTKDTRCPKCGRYPLKIQIWEKVLYALFFPAAIIGAIVHFGRSPRNAAIVFSIELIGLIAETIIYFVLRPF